MNKALERRWRSATVLAAMVLATSAAMCGALKTSHASDQEDTPQLEADADGDLVDVFAFMRPESTTHMAVVMTVNPKARTTTRFAPRLDYNFHFVGVADPQAGILDPSALDVTIACRFQEPSPDGSQIVACSGNGLSTVAPVGSADAGLPEDAMRVYAGLAANPAFADVAKLQATVSSGQLAFADGGPDSGSNAFAEKNVLAIVVEIDVDKVLFPGKPGGEPRPLVAVSAETVRLP